MYWKNWIALYTWEMEGALCTLYWCKNMLNVQHVGYKWYASLYIRMVNGVNNQLHAYNEEKEVATVPNLTAKGIIYGENPIGITEEWLPSFQLSLYCMSDMEQWLKTLFQHKNHATPSSLAGDTNKVYIRTRSDLVQCLTGYLLKDKHTPTYTTTWSWTKKLMLLLLMDWQLSTCFLPCSTNEIWTLCNNKICALCILTAHSKWQGEYWMVCIVRW